MPQVRQQQIWKIALESTHHGWRDSTTASFVRENKSMADKQVFQTLNGLRGIAALAVVAFHWELQDPLNLKYGLLAVDFFLF